VTDPYRATGDQLSAATLYALLTLRVAVFVVEQEAPYAELDGRDLRPDTVHLWFGDPEPLAYLRLLRDPGGVVRIGRVCTAMVARGAGLSSRLMIAALAEVGDRPAVLDAQVHAQNFYARFGFVPVGEPFEEDGIPHITMRRGPA
jgi:ElaA protein